MREFIKSLIRFSWAMPLFGAKQAANLLEPKDPQQPKDKASAALDSVAQAAAEQLGDTGRSVLEAVDKAQSGVVDAVFDTLSGGGPASGAGADSGGDSDATPSPGPKPDSGRLDVSTFVAVGGGLAAGMGNFTLSSATQRNSFPAQMAGKMGVEFLQPGIQNPGIGNPPGFNPLPAIVPAYQQTTVLENPNPDRALSNLSIPGIRASEALRLRPSSPMVRRDDVKLTTVNLILGASAFLKGKNGPWRSQIEYAVQRGPSLAVVELGFSEALEAATSGDLRRMPAPRAFKADYKRILASLSEAGAQLLALNIPNPIDTAYFSTIEAASQVVKVEPRVLLSAYNLKQDDLITVHGLYQIGAQFLSRSIQPLPKGSVLSAKAAEGIGRRVEALNAALSAAAKDKEAEVYDLHGLYRGLAENGIQVGSRTLGAGYLGGFYALNGYFPGQTGQALIANDLLKLLNNAYGASFPLIDVQAALKQDPVAAYRPAEGPNWTTVPPAPPRPPSEAQVSGPEPAMSSSKPGQKPPSTWAPLVPPEQPSPQPLKLPPGLEQVLPLSKAASYFGDSILAIDCLDAKSAQWGTCEDLLFSGLALTNSHLSGQLRIRFSPPVDNVSSFEVSILGSGLLGEDGILTSPRLFRLPSLQNRVQDFPGLVSSGKLDLATGTVLDAKFSFSFINTALLAIIQVNPNFPQVPIQFPGQYGSSWGLFEQRRDGKLDFTFYGSTFLPLGYDLGGDPVQFPLPFAGPSQQFASVTSRGTALHPHIQLSTKDPEGSECGDQCPEIPFNSFREYTMFTHNSSFGDEFGIDIPEWGGTATGRSQILGRVQIQFGEPAGDSVPVAVSNLNPGGLLAPLAPTPISDAFPGRLPAGPLGFNAILRPPNRSYDLDDLSVIDDPFDISVGAVSLKTGRLINRLLHPGFINQDLLFALLRVEPRTPEVSFGFRGPALLQKGARGETVFRFQGNVIVPYPAGFLFPKPNLATGYVVVRDGILDPFLWVHAIQGHGRSAKSGGGKNILSDTGDRFTYSYSIAVDSGRRKSFFEFSNHSQQGSYSLGSLTWVDFSNASGGPSGREGFDTVTFTGYGTWSKDGSESVQLASVQVSTSPKRPYVGIQIGPGGIVSNVNTKPARQEDALP